MEFVLKYSSSQTLGIVLFCALLAVVTAAIFVLGDPGEEEAAGIAPVVESGAGMESHVPSEAFEDDDAEIGEEADGGRIAVAPQEADLAHPSNRDRIHVKVRFLDVHGQPIEGVKVSQRSRSDADQKVSGPDGRIEGEFTYWEDSQEYVIRLNAEKKGYERLRESFRSAMSKAVDLGDLVLGPAGAVLGLVLDEAGMPVPDARVTCTPADLHELDVERMKDSGPRSARFEGWTSSVSTQSAEDGSFRIDGVPVGMIRVWAGTKTTFHSCTEPFELPPAAEITGLVLVLESRPIEDRIEGVVLYPDGTPFPRAKVRVLYKTPSYSGSSRFSTDEEGRFLYMLKDYKLTEEGAHSVEAYDREGRYLPVKVENVLPGTLDLVLQLTALRSLIFLSVRDEDGQFPAACEVKVYLEKMVRRSADDGFSGFYDRADKTYSFRSADFADTPEAELIRPDEDFWISVTAEGFQTVELGPYDPRLAPERLEAILLSLPGIKGRILAGAQPVEGARVSLHKPITGSLEYSVNGFVCRSVGDATASAKTDEEGRFCLWLGKSGTFYLRAEAVEHAPFEMGPLYFDNTGKRDDLEIALTRGGAIEGTVRTMADCKPDEIHVAISRGDGFPVSRRVGADGRYRFERLTPGYWQVEKSDEDRAGQRSYSISSSHADSGGEEPEWSCFVEDGKTTIFDLDLTRDSTCPLSGIFSIDGSIPARWRADIIKTGPLRFDRNRTVLSPDGRFALEGHEPGTYDLRINGYLGAGVRVLVEDVVDLSFAGTSWIYQLSSGKVEIHGAHPAEAGRTDYRLTWRASGNLVMTLYFEPDSDGYALIPVAPSGKAEIVRSVRDTETGRSEKEVLSEVDVLVGQTATVRLD